jgi:hypothetical protein
VTQPLARNCPLCDQPLDDYGPAPPVSGVRYRDTYQVRCRRCGVFIFAERAIAAMQPDQRHLLSAACRKWAEGSPPAITEINIEKLFRQVPRLTASEKLDSLLQELARKTPEMGALSGFSLDDDYPLIALNSPQEARALADVLQVEGYLTTSPEKGARWQITVKGWEKLDEIRSSGRQSSLAFVAMWFDEKMRVLYDDAIQPAIRDAGYEPLRIDQHEHVNRIDDEIIGQIRRSRFMVADFTGQRHGVYFEVGLMMGLGRNVIWMCNKEELHELHFDVRQYNLIDWESIEDARIRLHHRILRLEVENLKKE